MRIRPRPAVTRINLTGLVALLCLVPLARAQAGETITATAQVKSRGAQASAEVSVVIDRFTTDADRDRLLATLKERGTAGVRDLLLTWNPVGGVRVGQTNTVIKYAYSKKTGDGRLITVVTGSPILFIGAGLPGAPPKTGYDLGLVLLTLKPSGPGEGELVPAAKIRLDEQGGVTTDDYSDLRVDLSNVIGK